MIRYIRVLGPRSGAWSGSSSRAVAGCSRTPTYAGFLLAAWVVAWVIVGFAILPYLTVVPALADRARRGPLDRRVRHGRRRALLGLLMGLLLGFPLSAFRQPFGSLLPLGVSLFLGLGMLGLTVAKRKDLVGAAEARHHPSHAKPTRETTGGDPRIVVDTSAIIDGRIAEIVESGFIYGTLVIPRFVLDELQHIADSSDTLRRNRRPARPRDPGPDAEGAGHAGRDRRGRRARDRRGGREARRPGAHLQPGGPDERLQPQPGRGAPGRAGHEHQLAGERGEPAVLPGEELRVRVIQEGKEAGQGVGFLDDGTMIVVEGGARTSTRSSTCR